MQYILEQFGVTVAAVTGVLAARGKQVDLFGVIVLALVTAFGGGTLRDALLGTGPVFWTKDAYFLLNASGTAVVTFYLVRFRELPQQVLLVADAFALADAVVLMDVYSAGEAPIPGVSGKSLLDELLLRHPRSRSAYLPHRADIVPFLQVAHQAGLHVGQQGFNVLGPVVEQSRGQHDNIRSSHHALEHVHGRMHPAG